jgi:nitroreductase
MDTSTAQNQNETLTSIAQRRSIRLFNDPPVPDHLIRTILQTANQAPSAHNQQSWRFIITGEKRKEIAAVVTNRAGDFPRPSSALLRMATRSIPSAPACYAANTSGSDPQKLPVDQVVKHLA